MNHLGFQVLRRRNIEKLDTNVALKKLSHDQSASSTHDQAASLKMIMTRTRHKTNWSGTCSDQTGHKKHKIQKKDKH